MPFIKFILVSRVRCKLVVLCKMTVPCKKHEYNIFFLNCNRFKIEMYRFSNAKYLIHKYTLFANDASKQFLICDTYTVCIVS